MKNLKKLLELGNALIEPTENHKILNKGNKYLLVRQDNNVNCYKYNPNENDDDTFIGNIPISDIPNHTLVDFFTNNDRFQILADYHGNRL